MLQFDKLLAKMNVSVTETYGDNIVRNGDFSEHQLASRKKWGLMEDTGDGSWVAETGRIEVQKSSGHGGTPAKKLKSTVLELDALTGKRGLGATDSNSVVSQEIEEITGPGTYRLSLDYRGLKKFGQTIEETGTAEVWVGDKLVTVLTQERTSWEERIIEFTLEEGDLPAEGGAALKLVSTGKADGRGAQVDNISLREIGETGLLGDELVTNGDFEANGGGRGVHEAIPGWTVNEESVIELKSVRKPITPREKSDTYIELDSHGKDSNSTVVQEIEVPEDGTYLLAFDYSARAVKGKDAGATSPIKVMVGDKVIAEISADEAGWKPFTFNVDLVEGPVKLTFEGTGVEDSIGGLLDNVALRKVAELGPDADPINVPEPEVEAVVQTGFKAGLLGEVHFADAVLKKLDQALEHADETPDATFVATSIDYGNNTGWFHTDLDDLLEHDGESLVEHSDGALDQNVNHTVIQLTGEIYLEAGSHTFYNRTDDGFRLTIDGQEVAEYEGLRAAKTTKGSIEVSEDGWYDIAVDYFEWKGHSKLRIEHEANGGPREILDEDRLRHGSEPENQGPDAIDDVAEGDADAAINIDALANDTDPDGDTVFIVDATDGANGTVTFTPPNVEEIENSGEVTFGDNLITNGDFEANPLNGKIGWGHWDSIEGWESPVGRVEVQTADYSTGNERGNAVVELDSHGANSNSTLQQEVQIEEAGTYQFSLDYAMRGKHGWTNGLGVRVNGDTLYEVVKPTDKGFQKLVLDLELDPGAAVIEIYALGREDSIGTVIDNVSLRQVQPGEPERVFTAPDGGLITYTPEPGFTGEDTFTYTVSDGNGGIDTATVTVVVNDNQQAPVAAADQAETQEDVAIVLDLLANDSDANNDELTITELGEVANGTLVLNADGTVTFMPDTDFHGTVSFDYTISDGELTSTATATVVVTPVNDAVIAEDDTVYVDEDSSVTFDLRSNDVDVDGDALTITELGTVDHGALELNADGTVTFTPETDYHGTVTFEYTVTDGATTSTATATLKVRPVNDAVVAADDAFTTEEDTSIILDVLTNDSDLDGDDLTLTQVSEIEGGTLQINEDGTITFTPDADYHGTITFDYTVSDGTITDTATATVVVTPVNDGVEAINDSFRTDEDNAVTMDLLANDRDVDDDGLTITALGTTPDGVVELNADGSVTFTPSANFHGVTRFEYTVTDGQTASTAMATVIVDSVNDGPTGVADAAQTVATDPVIINVLANDLDVDGDVLSVESVGTSPDGTVELLADGTLSFTAHEDFTGTASFTYDVTDGTETDTVEVTVLVVPPNRAPEPQDDIVVMDEDGSITIDFLANDIDPDGDALTLDGFGTVRNGSLILNDDGTVTFTPDADYVGDVTIRYTLSDEEGLTGTADIEITVENVNDGPVTEDDFDEVSREETITVDVLQNDSDVDDDDVLELVSATTSRGQVTIVDGELLFDPLDDFADMEVETTTQQVVTYTIRDTAGATQTGTLTLTVSAPRQDKVNETLGFTDFGSSGSSSNMDAEAGFLAVDAVGLEGADNDDRLKIDLNARGGHGRSAGSASRGDSGDGGNGEAGSNADEDGGTGGDAFAELTDAFLTGNVFEDRLDVEVEAKGGNGGRGGAGGNGGDADPLGQHTEISFGGGETVTDYGEGTAFTGGDGGNASRGAAGGEAYAVVLGGVFDGGVDDDEITVEVSATGGDGGNGKAGGRAGDGGNDAPAGGDHVNTSRSGDGGDGGRGGDALAELADASLIGGSGADELSIVVEVEAGEGGDGGNGGDAGAGLYLDTTRTDNGIFLDATFEGEVFAIMGDAGNGGTSGDNGSATALVADNLMDGGDGDDELVLEVIVEIPDAVLGGSAGDNGIDGTLTPEETGDYTLHQTAGGAGTDGADGAAGSALAEITGNTLDGGAGDDLFELIIELTGEGDTDIVFEDNEILGGTGHDTADFSEVGAALDVDLGAGRLALGDGGDNAISGIEYLIATNLDDRIFGASQSETLTGGKGDDVLSGGGGLDIFVFDDGDGADVIEDFTADLLDFSKHSSAQTFFDLLLSDTAEGAVIAMNSGETILLRGVSSSEITEENFVF